METTNLPTLTGSQKQIAWAEGIRKEMLAESFRGKTYSELVNQFLGWTEANKEQLATLAESNPSHELARVYFLATETSAKWYIDNRTHGSFKAGGKTIMSW